MLKMKEKHGDQLSPLTAINFIFTWIQQKLHKLPTYELNSSNECKKEKRNSCLYTSLHIQCWKKLDVNEKWHVYEQLMNAPWMQSVDGRQLFSARRDQTVRQNRSFGDEMGAQLRGEMHFLTVFVLLQQQGRVLWHANVCQVRRESWFWRRLRMFVEWPCSRFLNRDIKFSTSSSNYQLNGCTMYWMSNNETRGI